MVHVSCLCLGTSESHTYDAAYDQHQFASCLHPSFPPEETFGHRSWFVGSWVLSPSDAVGPVIGVPFLFQVRVAPVEQMREYFLHRQQE